MKITKILHVEKSSKTDTKKEVSIHDTHNSRLYRLLYFTDGSGTLTKHTVKNQFGPGALFLSPTDDRINLDFAPNILSASYYIIEFEVISDPAIEILTRMIKSGNAVYKVGLSKRLLLDEILSKYNSGNLDLIKSSEYMLLAFIYEVIGSSIKNNRRTKSRHVEKAISIMHSFVGRGMNLDDICAKLEISRSHLSKIFKETVGQCPNTYFSQLRMDAAKTMLSETHLRVQEIAERLGYTSPFSFSRAFSQITGQSPTAYRNQSSLSNPSSEAGDPVIVHRP